MRSKFFHGIRKLAVLLYRSVSATGTRINFFTLFRVISKLDFDEVPADLLKIQKQRQKANHYKYLNSVYEIRPYSSNLLRVIEEMCQVWLEKGCTSKTINYEGIFRTFGRDEADRVFKQDKGKEVAPINQEIVFKITWAGMQLIEYKGWATKTEIIEKVVQLYLIKKEIVTRQFDRCLAEMLDAYDLESIGTNKKIKQEMGITEEFMGKNCFPKIIRRKHPAEDCHPQQGTR